MSNLLSTLSVLYVEDEEDIRSLLQRALTRKVKNLYVGIDGVDGFNLFEKHRPDIILTDIKMPKMNGINMAKRIKKIDKEVPIIVLSAHSETNYFLEAIESGISGYLLKPLDKQKLYDILEENAKIVLFGREKKLHELLLQELIDLQPSVIFSTDESKSALFLNKLFIDNFTVEGFDAEDYDKSSIYSQVKKFNNTTLVDGDKDVFWLDYVFDNPNTSFKVSVKKESSEVFFYVRTKLVHPESIGKVVIVITLVEL